ncbi:MAG: bifunctional pyr operon transcriptional regulator/uracil phosphoribosyltransferase PyrR [Magnetococcales bacterium]|nr:bifunctional pyr operon transcriptional regulator/uracil phosphoribosyltransferase PyrR [Magnetococcales bacterium]
MSVTNAREEMLLPAEETLTVIRQLAERIREGIDPPEKRVVVVGIRRGGAVVARLLRDTLSSLLGRELPIGFLDITFYRDDLRTIAPNPVVGATDLTMQIDNRCIILVDDVLFTGRTIRAALNALFDYGRPDSVRLAVLVDRGGRQLPIQPDFAGRVVKAGNRESIKLVERERGEWVVVRRRLTE